MPLTRPFTETVRARARRDPEYREGLLTNGVRCLLGGETNVAKQELCDYIETTMGYQKLAKFTGTPPEKLAFMFAKTDNADAHALLKVLIAIQQYKDIQFEVKAVPAETDEEEETEVEAEVETAAAAR